MPMPGRLVAFVLAFCATMLLPARGWAQEQRGNKSDTPRGVVFVLGGVGGWDVLPHSVRFGLNQAGVKHEVRDFVWTHGVGKVLRDLQDFRHLDDKADELAAQIVRERDRDVDRPIYIVANSGGTGLALKAAERLPAGTVDRIILTAAAVSPGYDLRPALRATRGQIVSFYSPLDQLVLNWGTRKFGTIDRYYGPSAGLTGFSVSHDPDDPDRGLYDRLVQIPWTPRMLLRGHFGGHASNSMPRFFANEVAVWLK